MMQGNKEVAEKEIQMKEKPETNDTAIAMLMGAALLAGIAIAMLIVWSTGAYDNPPSVVVVEERPPVEIPRQIIKVEIVEIRPADYKFLQHCRELATAWWDSDVESVLYNEAAETYVASGCLD